MRKRQSSNGMRNGATSIRQVKRLWRLLHGRGSLLRLPYNIDVSDNNDQDVSLIKYIGRKHPVSYYGTQIGSTSTWNTDIPSTDVDTLYAVRRLSVWMGNAYVREPSGSGYWASVKVNYNQKHTGLTIPVTLDITRVEGGA